MKNNFDKDNILVFFVISAFLHLLIFVGSDLSFFSLKKDLPQDEIFTMEILPISDVSRVKNQKVQKEKTVINQDAKKIESKPEKSSAPKLEEEKIEEKIVQKNEQVKENLPKNIVKIPESKPKVEKEKEKNKKQEKKKNSSEKKKLPVKNKKIASDNELDNLLKNLEKSSNGDNQKSRKVNREKNDAKQDAFSKLDDVTNQSLTSDEFIKQQILKNWLQPISTKSEDIVVTVELFILQDGSIDSLKIVNVKCPFDKDMLCQVTKDSVLRAIKLSSPLSNLDKQDYSTWKNIIVHFNTKSKFR